MGTRKITKLTADQEKRIVEFRNEWLSIGLSCDPANFAEGDAVINGFYRRLNRPEPLILHFSSPAMCELAANIVIGQLSGQLSGQLRSQLDSQLRSQLYGQLHSQLYGQLSSQLRSQLDSQLRSHKPYFLRNRFGSGHWCAWEAFYLFGHEIGVNYKADDLALLLEWGRLSKSIGWWAPWDGVCFVSDRPRGVHFDDDRRLHCETGMAAYYSDGWGCYAWHGVAVPGHWIENRATLDPVEVLKTPQVEQRAAGMAIVGWPKAEKVLQRKVIDGDPDSDMGALIELTLPGLPEAGRFLRAVCPRNGIIIEGVPRVSDIDGLPIDTVVAAQAWRIGDPQAEYIHPPKRT